MKSENQVKTMAENNSHNSLICGLWHQTVCVFFEVDSLFTLLRFENGKLRENLESVELKRLF